jgi:uncharacterized coiled-coil protein SlyX
MNPVHLKPSAEVVARVAELTQPLLACEATNAALDRILEEEKTLKTGADALIAERASMLAERARQTDPATIRKFGPKLDELDSRIAEQSRGLESISIARAQLERELEENEGRIQQLREAGKVRQTYLLYASDVACGLYLEIEAAIANHVLPLCVEAVALQSALQSPEIGQWLSDLRIPMMGGINRVLLSGTEANLAGDRILLSERGASDADVVEMRAAAANVRERLLRLDQYVPRRRRALPAPYERRGYTTEGVAGERRAAEDVIAEVAKNPTPRPRTADEALAASKGVATNESAGAYRAREAREANVASGVLADPDLAQFR